MDGLCSSTRIKWQLNMQFIRIRTTWQKCLMTQNHKKFSQNWKGDDIGFFLLNCLKPKKYNYNLICTSPFQVTLWRSISLIYPNLFQMLPVCTDQSYLLNVYQEVNYCTYIHHLLQSVSEQVLFFPFLKFFSCLFVGF